MSKCDQYATNDAKVFTGLTSVSIKEVFHFVKNHNLDQKEREGVARVAESVLG